MSKAKGQFSFFNLEERLEKIHRIADFLPKLDTLVDRLSFMHFLGLTLADNVPDARRRHHASVDEAKYEL